MATKRKVVLPPKLNGRRARGQGEREEGLLTPLNDKIPSQNISFHTMSILEPERSGNSTGSRVDEIVFLYRLVPGRVVSSYGIHCAELAGVPQEVLERCVEVLECTKEGRPIERLGTKRTTAMDQIWKAMGEHLQKFDCEKDDLNNFLSEAFALLAS